jgi:hypothetical protein
MKMCKAVHAVFFALFWIAFNAAGADDERVHAIFEKYGGWNATTYPSVVARMSADERATLTRYYKDRLSGSAKDQIPPDAKRMYKQEYEQALLELGDPDILARNVDAVLQNPTDSPKGMQAVRNLDDALLPETVPMLVPGLFSNDPLELHWAGDAAVKGPRSLLASGIMLTITSRSTYFSQETRQWAAQTRNGGGMHDVIPMMRKWWQDNEQFFRGKNYGAVRPGPDIVTKRREEYRKSVLEAEEYRRRMLAAEKVPADSKNSEAWRQENVADSGKLAPPTNIRSLLRGGVFLATALAVLIAGWLIWRKALRNTG